jgi:hypothetical protein
MDSIRAMAANGVAEYFDMLSKYGYAPSLASEQLLALILLDDFVRGPLATYSNEKDMRYIESYRSCLVNSSCLIPLITGCDTTQPPAQ